MPDGSTHISRIDQIIALARDLQPHHDFAAARELIEAAGKLLSDKDPMKRICETYALADYLEDHPDEAGDNDYERELYFDGAALVISEAGEELVNRFTAISEHYAGY